LLSYPHLDVAQKSNQAGKPDKFSAAFVFTPELLADAAEKAKFNELQQAVIAAVNDKYGDKGPAMLKSEGFKKGLRRDAESKGYPEGSVFLTARSTNQPGLVYTYPDPVTKKAANVKQEDIKKVFYPGAIVRPLISIFMFDKEGNRGVSFGLEGIQFIKDGPRIDNRVNAEDAFDVDLSAEPASLDDLI
jgi:hypothetical protein